MPNSPPSPMMYRFHNVNKKRRTESTRPRVALCAVKKARRTFPLMDLPDELLLLIVGFVDNTHALYILSQLARRLHTMSVNALLRINGVPKPTDACVLRLSGGNDRIPDALTALRTAVAITETKRLDLTFEANAKAQFNSVHLRRVRRVLAKLGGVEDLAVRLPYGAKVESAAQLKACMQGFNEIIRLVADKGTCRSLALDCGFFPTGCLIPPPTNPLVIRTPLPLTTLALHGNLFLSVPTYEMIVQVIRHSPQLKRIALKNVKEVGDLGKRRFFEEVERGALSVTELEMSDCGPIVLPSIAPKLSARLTFLHASIDQVFEFLSKIPVPPTAREYPLRRLSLECPVLVLDSAQKIQLADALVYLRQLATDKRMNPSWAMTFKYMGCDILDTQPMMYDHSNECPLDWSGCDTITIASKLNLVPEAYWAPYLHPSLIPGWLGAMKDLKTVRLEGFRNPSEVNPELVHDVVARIRFLQSDVKDVYIGERHVT
ncbi:hypothetical protein K525DRAFT_362326 [Schizophyllum commune Loenen D]|nr:hypothetical protein K525DRAFT_362326 [Schizophyllum commune Loenen D]